MQQSAFDPFMVLIYFVKHRLSQVSTGSVRRLTRMKLVIQCAGQNSRTRAHLAREQRSA